MGDLGPGEEHRRAVRAGRDTGAATGRSPRPSPAPWTSGETGIEFGSGWGPVVVEM